LPEEPENPITSPAPTYWPTETVGRDSMWQYRVMTWPACRMSTYQPQPATAGLPSTSQLYAWPNRRALQVATSTTPEAAARIGVPCGTAMSTPLWAGRAGGRNGDTTDPASGRVQPDAAISPSATQRSVAADPAARPAPPVRASTTFVASGSCLA